MSRLISIASFATIVALALSACSDSTAPTTVSLTAVSPAPSVTAVSPSTTIVLTFGQPMMAGMEQYIDLHQGGITGPTVPMNCAWNPDRTVITCTPGTPLGAHTPFCVHIGAGITDAAGHVIAMNSWTHRGGEWATGEMMGGMHNGQPMGMMGGGWMHSDHYGMLFTFTTG